MSTLHITKVKKVKLLGRVVYPMVGAVGIKSEKMSFGVAELPSRSKMEPHKHISEEEIIYITEGFGKLYVEGKETEQIEPGTVIVAPKGVMHAIENESSNKMRWCWVFSPPVKIGSHTSS